jgi:hypothetical protein
MMNAMGDPFRNPLASMNARVESLERENQALRRRLATLNNELEMGPLRRGRASWLLSGLITSFFPLIAVALFFSAPKAPWLARRARPVPAFAPALAPPVVAARAGDDGAARGAFRGVALSEHRGHDELSPPRGPGDLAQHRGHDEAPLSARPPVPHVAHQRPIDRAPPYGTRLDHENPWPKAERRACSPSDPLCVE